MMTRTPATALATLLALGLAAPGRPAGPTPSATPERTTVPLTDPARPVRLEAHTINGSITVTGYDGRDVVVEARPATREDGREGEAKGAGRYPGMKLVPTRSTGLSIEERDNRVTVNTESWRTPLDLAIQVPRHASLELGCVNDCDIVVEKVEGEVEAQNVNGAITLDGISGSAVANTTNGAVKVAFERVEPGRAMSFVTLNGNVELTLPAATKANLSLGIDHQGDVYSDFEIAAAQAAPPQTGKRGSDGRFVLEIERALRGTINGGGPELTLRTFNGDIVLRKAK
jgi:hypothetical protein